MPNTYFTKERNKIYCIEDFADLIRLYIYIKCIFSRQFVNNAFNMRNTHSN